MNRMDFLKPVPINGKIRIGRNYDGGYVVYVGALDQVEVLLTYGIGWDTDFEERFQEKTGANVYMFDPTMYYNNEWIDIKRLSSYLYRLQPFRALSYLTWMLRWKMKLKRFKSEFILFREGHPGCHPHDNDTYKRTSPSCVSL